MANRNEIGTFLLRIVLGLVFFAHGVTKFQDGIGNTVGWFESIGLPGFLAYAVGTIEVVGGIAVILGIGTRIVALLFSIVLVGAIFTVKLPNGFLNGYAYDLILLTIAIYMVLNGSRLFSLGGAFKGMKSQS
ncbi:DoxX family protein [Virgibacillus kekensis]|uniref:DoxX family protein n=1 Tax=Virgibacillus kekensis TaxID=202261 RepID=A0ABV9DJU3_9BACI